MTVLTEIWTSNSRPSVFVLVVLSGITYLLGNAIYNLFFHPLSRFPGPWTFAISRATYSFRHMRGTLTFEMLELHEKYGNVVRIAPDELAFAHPDAWKEILGHKLLGEQMTKPNWFYRPVEGLPAHIVNENSRQSHGALRRQFAHSFSEKSMKDQEPLIRHYVDSLIFKLREKCSQGNDMVNLTAWYNYTIFDIIGDLAFGEPFGCLEGADLSEWIKGIFQSARVGTIMQMLAHIPLARSYIPLLIPKSIKEAQEHHNKQTKEKMIRRVQRGEERPDLIESLISKQEDLNLSLDNLVANAEILIIAGSETTATALCGVTYFLLTNRDALEKLVKEVRSTFSSEEEIDLISVGQLTYMLACLNEALRMYPPVASGLPRVVPQGGTKVLDNFIPENTHVSIHHWALYRREDYFTDAHNYHPERFLDDPKFANDRRDVLQPFHVGPRNCLGRNLAYSEMRLILARIIYNFDMRLDDSSVDWIKQRNFNLWEKGALNVHLTPVRAS